MGERDSVRAICRGNRRSTAWRRAASFSGALVVVWGALPALALAGPTTSQVEVSEPPKTMESSWWDRTEPGRNGPFRTRFYRIRSDLSAEETKALGRHLDTMYLEFQRRLGTLEQRVPEVLDVLIFQSQREYLETLRERFGINAMGSGGMFFRVPRGAALAFFVEKLPRSRVLHVMQHEGFHQYAYSRFVGDLPIWANEGLAEFFGESVVVDGTVVIGQTSERALDALRKAIDAGKHFRFRDLITMDPERWGANVRQGGAALQYMQAWSMVHFLVYGDNGRYTKAFEQYLRLLNRSTPPYEAFVRAFGTDDLESFEERWIAHTRTARPSAFVTAVERIEFLAEGLKFLAEKDIHPPDLETLRLELVEAKFTTEIGGIGSVHGPPITLTADDHFNFQIPDDDLAKGTPTFALIESKPRRGANRKERELDLASPLPPAITTRDLAPRNLTMRWQRDESGKSFRYVLEVGGKVGS